MGNSNEQQPATGETDKVIRRLTHMVSDMQDQLIAQDLLIRYLWNWDHRREGELAQTLDIEINLAATINGTLSEPRRKRIWAAIDRAQKPLAQATM